MVFDSFLRRARPRRRAVRAGAGERPPPGGAPAPRRRAAGCRRQTAPAVTTRALPRPTFAQTSWPAPGPPAGALTRRERAYAARRDLEDNPVVRHLLPQGQRVGGLLRRVVARRQPAGEVHAVLGKDLGRALDRDPGLRHAHGL